MNTSIRIKELNDELKAIKTAYSQNSRNLVLYNYQLDVDIEYPWIDQTVTFTTEDGSNTLAIIDGATYIRMPFEGGAKFYLYTRQGDRVFLRSLQKGTVTIS